MFSSTHVTMLIIGCCYDPVSARAGITLLLKFIAIGLVSVMAPSFRSFAQNDTHESARFLARYDVGEHFTGFVLSFDTRVTSRA